jgi:hypothetical protein
MSAALLSHGCHSNSRRQLSSVPSSLCVSVLVTSLRSLLHVLIYSNKKRCCNIHLNNWFFYMIVMWKVSHLAQSVELLTMRWTTRQSRFDPRQGPKDISSSLCVQTGCGDHPASCTMGTGGPCPRSKARPERDADHSRPSNAYVENE